MNNFRQKLARKETYARLRIPVIVALVTLPVLIALVPTVGYVWFGWWDIAQNRKVLDSLPLPPGAELINIDSEPNYTVDTLIIPHSWSTLAKYQIPGHTPEYLTEFYVSRLYSKWDYCIRRSVPGARFVARQFVVSIDASGAATRPADSGSFEILIEFAVRRNPCANELKRPY